jgi:hypothetical protein
VLLLKKICFKLLLVFFLKIIAKISGRFCSKISEEMILNFLKSFRNYHCQIKIVDRLYKDSLTKS